MSLSCHSPQSLCCSNLLFPSCSSPPIPELQQLTVPELPLSQVPMLQPFPVYVLQKSAAPELQLFPAPELQQPAVSKLQPYPNPVRQQPFEPELQLSWVLCCSIPLFLGCSNPPSLSCNCYQILKCKNLQGPCYSHFMFSQSPVPKLKHFLVPAPAELLLSPLLVLQQSVKSVLQQLLVPPVSRLQEGSRLCHRPAGHSPGFAAWPVEGSRLCHQSSERSLQCAHLLCRPPEQLQSNQPFG